MKAYVYEIAISDGAMDVLHGFSYGIRELYIPKYGLYANMGGNKGQMLAFKDTEDRFKSGIDPKEIDIPDVLATDLRHYVFDREAYIETSLKKMLEK